jgi:predicted RND superfamily exporter protein
LIPIFFSFLAPPQKKDLAHFESVRVNKFLNRVDLWVSNHRRSIYGFISIILVVSIYGLTKIQAVGFIVDDLPRDNAIYTDLKFVEDRFKGVMPFEINIDAYEKGRALTPELLAKIKRTEKILAKYP